MSEAKKPQAGEWWFNGDRRRYIVWIKLDGKTVWQRDNSGYLESGHIDWSSWHHEPDCTGWDWEQPDWVEITDPEHEWRQCDFVKYGNGEWIPSPWHEGCEVKIKHIKATIRCRCLRKDLPPVKEEFPQYFKSSQSEVAFIRRNSELETVSVNKNGIENKWVRAWNKDDNTRIKFTEEQALALLDPPPKVIPIRLWISKDVMKGKLRHMFVYNPDDEHDAILNGCVEIKFDAASQRFVVEGE